jgi:hypothetical protein
VKVIERMTGPPDAVPRSLPVSSLWPCTDAYNLCQTRPRRVYLADEVAGNYRAVDVLVSEAEWRALGAAPAAGFWAWCRVVAARVRTRGFHKHPRGPKKPRPPRASGKERHHYSTYRLLNEEKT